MVRTMAEAGRRPRTAISIVRPMGGENKKVSNLLATCTAASHVMHEGTGAAGERVGGGKAVDRSDFHRRGSIWGALAPAIRPLSRPPPATYLEQQYLLFLLLPLCLVLPADFVLARRSVGPKRLTAGPHSSVVPTGPSSALAGLATVGPLKTPDPVRAEVRDWRPCIRQMFKHAILFGTLRRLPCCVEDIVHWLLVATNREHAAAPLSICPNTPVEGGIYTSLSCSSYGGYARQKVMLR